MDARSNYLTAMTETSGAVMMIVWTLVLGPLGLLFLLGTAYAMITQNMALGIVCGLFMFSPLILTVVWAPLLGLTLLRERWWGKVGAAPETDPPT